MIVLLHHTADKYLDRLNASDRERIEAALANLEKKPPEGDITPMSGEPGRFRARVGSYRFLYRIKDNTVLVTHIDPRGQVYKKKNRGKKR
jgi:mRNA-degrading endonuclease RelE of RelBE toxin-antitoxin system